ncbi:hypothetical protein ACFY4I_08360 [Streptomyces scabiei]|uniref:hypothetical protein n=1 Tax=Streptomyces scabiei TaxID=1930 RepID=UPI0036811C35
MPAWFNSLWPVATFILGLASTYFLSFLTEKRQIAREADARQAERDRTLTERRETFELESLTKLADALQRYGRSSVRVHLADMPGRDEAQVYAASPLPSELDETLRLHTAEVSLLRSMILENELRNQVTAVMDALRRTLPMAGGNPREAERVHMQGVLLLDGVMEAVGSRIREIYVTATPPAA